MNSQRLMRLWGHNHPLSWHEVGEPWHHGTLWKDIGSLIGVSAALGFVLLLMLLIARMLETAGTPYYELPVHFLY